MSDHDIIITDAIIKPNYNKSRPQKRYLYSKAKWDELNQDIKKISAEIEDMVKENTDINTIWETFKNRLHAAIDEHIPSKIFKKKNNVPWMTRSLKRMLRRKERLYRAAKKS